MHGSEQTVKTFQEMGGQVMQTPEVNHSREEFITFLDQLSEVNSEVRDRQAELMEAGNELIESFGIKPEFFADPDRATIFASLAGNYASSQASARDSWSEGVRQREFVANATFLLARNFTDQYGLVKDTYEDQEQNGSQNVSEKATLETFEKYTDKELTEAVNNAAKKNGWFEEVLDRLGIDEEEAVPVSLRVLNIGADYEGILFKNPQNELEWSELMEWGKGLEERRASFIRDLDHIPNSELITVAAGFAITLDGHRQIAIPMAKAELLLADERGISINPDYQSDQQRVQNTLKHEFVHQQASVKVEEVFGYSLEERRAEYFSGDSGEYFDVKRFFNHLGLLNGIHINKLFDNQAAARREGKEQTIYGLLAETYGLDMVAQIAVAMPEPYARNARSEVVRDMLAQLGTYDELIKRYGAGLSDSQKQEAQQRLRQLLAEAEKEGRNMEFLDDYWSTAKQVVGISGQ